MSTLVSGYKGNVDLLIKGAPDRIVNKCSNMLSKDGSRAFQGSEKAELLKQIGELAGKGLRCLAIAEMQGAGELSVVTEQNKGSKLKDIK
jgi:magnesium-transporting ATPase (P-type)